LCSTTVDPPSPPCPEECNCLRVCNIVLKGEDSRAVGPCAKTGTLDLTLPEFEHDFCACGNNTPRWSIEEYDTTFFTSVTLTRAGVLTWVTKGPETIDKIFGEIVIKVCCGSLEVYSRILIGVKDLCNCPSCNDCELCDPCSGDCIEPDININFQTVPQSANTSINAIN